MAEEELTNGQANFSEVLEVSVDPTSFVKGLENLTEKYNEWVAGLGENAPAVTGLGSGAASGLKEVQEQFKTFASQAKATFDLLGTTLDTLAGRVLDTQKLIDEEILGGVKKEADGQKQRVTAAVNANEQILQSCKDLYAKEEELANRPKRKVFDAIRDYESGPETHYEGTETKTGEQFSLRTAKSELGPKAFRDIVTEQEGVVNTGSDARYAKQIQDEEKLNAVEAKRDAARKRSLEEWIQLLGTVQAEYERLVTLESTLPRPSVNPPVLPPVPEGTVLSNDVLQERAAQQEAIFADNDLAKETRTARIAAEDRIAEVKQQINKLELEHTAALNKSAGVMQEILQLEEKLALVRVRGDLDAKSGVLRGQLDAKKQQLAELEPSRTVDQTGLSTEEITKLTAKQEQYKAVLADIKQLTNDLSVVDEKRFALASKRYDERIAAETRQLTLTEQLAAAEDKVALAGAGRNDIEAQRAVHQATLDRVREQQAEVPATAPLAATDRSAEIASAEAEERRLSGIVESIDAKLNAAQTEQVANFTELERLQAELLESNKLGQATRVDQVHEANQEILSDYERLSREITAKLQEIQGVKERVLSAHKQEEAPKSAAAEEVQQAVRPTPVLESTQPPAQGTPVSTKPEVPVPVEALPTVEPPLLKVEELAPLKIEPQAPLKVEQPPVVKVDSVSPLKVDSPPVVTVEPIAPIKTEPAPLAHIDAVPPIKVDQPPAAKVEAVPPIKVDQPPAAKVEAVPPIKVEQPAPAKVEAVPPIKVDQPPTVKVEAVPLIKVEQPGPAKVEAVPPIKVEAVPPIKVEQPAPAKVEAVPPIKVDQPPIAKIEAVPLIKVEQPGPAKVEAVPPIKVDQPPTVKVETPAPLKVEATPPLKVDVPSPLKVESVPPLKVEAPAPLKVEPTPPLKVETPAPVKAESQLRPETTPLPASPAIPPDRKALLDQLNEYFTKQLDNAGKLSAADTELYEKNEQLLRLLEEEQGLAGKYNVQLDVSAEKLQRIVGLKERIGELGKRQLELRDQRDVVGSDLTAAKRTVQAVAEPVPPVDTADIEAQNTLIARRTELRLQEAAATRNIQSADEQLKVQDEQHETLLSRVLLLREKIAVAAARENLDQKREVLQGQLESKQRRLTELEPALEPNASQSSSVYADRNKAIEEYNTLLKQAFAITLDIDKVDAEHNAILDQSLSLVSQITALQEKLDLVSVRGDLTATRDVLQGQLDTTQQHKAELEPTVNADRTNLGTEDLKAVTAAEERYRDILSDEVRITAALVANKRQLEVQEDRISALVEKRLSLELKASVAALDGKPAEQAALWADKLKQVEAELAVINQLRVASPTGRLSEAEEANAVKLTAQAETFKAKQAAALKEETTLQERYTAAVQKTTDAQQKLASTNLTGNTAAQLDLVIARLAATRAEMARLQATGSLNIAPGGTISPTDVQNQEAYANAIGRVHKGTSEQISLVKQLGQEHTSVFASIVDSFSGALTVALKYSLAYGAIFEALRGLKAVAMAPFEGIKEGIGYLKDLEDKSYDLGAVFAANAKFSSDFGTNMKLSHQAGVEAMKELQDKAIALRIPLDAAVGSLRGLLEGKGLDLTRTPKELVDVAADLQVIAKTRPKDSKFSQQQLQGDLPKLFSEDVEQGNAYLQILQLTVGQWQAMVEHAGRFKDLQEQLNAIPVFKPLLEAAKQSQGNLSVLEQTFELLRKRIEAVGASEAFDKMKVGLEGLNKWIEAHGTEIEAVLKGIVSLIVNVVTSLVRMSNATGISGQLAGFLKGLALDFTVLATAAATTFDSIATGAEIAAASATLHLSKIPGLISDFKQRQNEREDTERAVAAQIRGVSSPTPAVSPQTQGALDKYKAELTQQEEVYNKAEARNKSWAAESTKRITDLGKQGVLTQEEVTKQIGDINKKQAEGVAAFAKQQADAAAKSMAEFQKTTKQVGTGVINTPTEAAGTVVPLKGNVTELEAELSKAEAEYKSGVDAAKNKAADARQDIEDLAKTTPGAYKKAAAEIAGINAEELRKLDELARAVLTKAAEVKEKLAAKGKDQTISNKEQEKALAAFDTKLENLNTSIENTKSQTARSGKRDVRTAEQEEVRSETSNLGEDKDRVLADAEYVKQQKINDARELFAVGKSTEAELHKAVADALNEEKALVDQVISAYKTGINDVRNLDPTTRGKLLNTADVAGTRKDTSIDREVTADETAAAREKFASEKALADSELAFLKQQADRKIQLARDAGASETQIADLTAQAHEEAFTRTQAALAREIGLYEAANDTRKLLQQKYDQNVTINDWQMQADAAKRSTAVIKDSLSDLEHSYSEAAEAQKLVLRVAEDSSFHSERQRQVVLQLAQSYLDLAKAQQLHLQQLQNAAIDSGDQASVDKVTAALNRQKEAVIQLTQQRDAARKKDTSNFSPEMAQVFQQVEEKRHDAEILKDLQDQLKRAKEERTHLETAHSVDKNKPLLDASTANTGALHELTVAIKALKLPQPESFAPKATAGQPAQEVAAVPQPASVQPPPVTVTLPQAIPDALRGIVAKASQITGLDSELITAVMRQESRFDVNAVSPKGAQGLMQLMPGTAKEQGVTNAFDASQNVIAGAKYLAGLIDRFDGNLSKALAAYNAGPARVESGKQLPAETIHFVEKITAALAAIASSRTVASSPVAVSTPTLPLAAQNLPTPPPFSETVSPHGFAISGQVASLGQPPIQTTAVATEVSALQKLTEAIQSDVVSRLATSLKANAGKAEEGSFPAVDPRLSQVEASPDFQAWVQDHPKTAIDTNVPSISTAERSPEDQAKLDDNTKTIETLTKTIRDLTKFFESKKGFSVEGALDTVTGGAVSVFKQASAKKAEDKKNEESTVGDTTAQIGAIVGGITNVFNGVFSQIENFKKAKQEGGTLGGVGSILDSGISGKLIGQIPIAGPIINAVGGIMQTIGDMFVATTRKIAAEIKTDFDTIMQEYQNKTLTLSSTIQQITEERQTAITRLSGRKGGQDQLAQLLPQMDQELAQLKAAQADIVSKFDRGLSVMKFQSDTLTQINQQWQSINDNVKEYIEAGGSAAKASQYLGLALKEIEKQSADTLRGGYQTAVQDAIQLNSLTQQRVSLQKSFNQQEFSLVNQDSVERTQAGAVSRGQQLELMRQDFQKQMDDLNASISLTTQKVSAESKVFSIATNINELHRQDEALTMSALNEQLKAYMDIERVVASIKAGKDLGGASKGLANIGPAVQKIDDQINLIQKGMLWQEQHMQGPALESLLAQEQNNLASLNAQKQKLENPAIIGPKSVLGGGTTGSLGPIDLKSLSSLFTAAKGTQNFASTINVNISVPNLANPTVVGKQIGASVAAEIQRQSRQAPR